MSGKGGVGKSTLTTNLAYALASDPSTQVAVLDIDLCGPSQARMFGVEDSNVHRSAEGWVPVYPQENIAVMSAALVIESRDQALIMRGPRKYVIIKQFLSEVDWDEVDYLLVDTPPGTSDEHINIVQLLLEASNIDGAIIITTPQEVSLLDVRKEVSIIDEFSFLNVVLADKLLSKNKSEHSRSRRKHVRIHLSALQARLATVSVDDRRCRTNVPRVKTTSFRQTFARSELGRELRSRSAVSRKV